MGRVLTTINPQWVADEVAYHYGLAKFVVKPKPSFGKAYPLYIYQGTAIRKDSEEAKAQIAAGYGNFIVVYLKSSTDFTLNFWLKNFDSLFMS